MSAMLFCSCHRPHIDLLVPIKLLQTVFLITAQVYSAIVFIFKCANDLVHVVSAVEVPSTNVLWIRNCRRPRPGRQAGSRRTFSCCRPTQSGGRTCPPLILKVCVSVRVSVLSESRLCRGMHICLNDSPTKFRPNSIHLKRNDETFFEERRLRLRRSIGQPIMGSVHDWHQLILKATLIMHNEKCADEMRRDKFTCSCGPHGVGGTLKSTLYNKTKDHNRMIHVFLDQTRTEGSRCRLVATL